MSSLANKDSTQSKPRNSSQYRDVFLTYSISRDENLSKNAIRYQNDQKEPLPAKDLMQPFMSEEVKQIYTVIYPILIERNNNNAQLNSIVSQHTPAELESILIFYLEDEIYKEPSDISISIKKTDSNVEQPINISEIHGSFDGEHLIGKISIKTEPKKPITCNVKFNKKISSSYLKLWLISDIISKFSNAIYVTVIDERMSLSDDYNTRVTKYLKNHPNCVAVFPHVSIQLSCTISSVYQFMNVFFSNYHQIESYSFENVMGVISHPRNFCFTTKKENFCKLITDEVKVKDMHNYLSKSTSVYMSISAFSGIYGSDYQYMYYDQTVIAKKEYPPMFESFVSKESQYYSDHIASFIAMYSLGMQYYKSKSPKALKAYFTFYLMFSLIPKIIDFVMPSILLVLYYTLFYYFFRESSKVTEGVIVSTLIYLTAIIISLTQMVTRCSKWITLVCISVIGVLHCIMIGLYIKYTFLISRPMVVAAFSLLIVSYPIITGLAYHRIFQKKNSAQMAHYMAGMLFHVFTYPFHHLFLFMQSLLLRSHKKDAINKGKVKHSNGVRTIIITCILVANIIVFCVFCTIDYSITRGYMMLIEILSYYFVITCSLKVIFVLIDLIRSKVVDKKKYTSQKAHLDTEAKIQENKNEPVKQHISESSRKLESTRMQAQKEPEPSKVQDVIVNTYINSNTKLKSPTKEANILSQSAKHKIMKEPSLPKAKQEKPFNSEFKDPYISPSKEETKQKENGKSIEGSQISVDMEVNMPEKIEDKPEKVVDQEKVQTKYILPSASPKKSEEAKM